MSARPVPLRLLCFAIFLLAVSIRVAWLPTMSRADLTSNTVTPDGHRSFDECINVALALYNGNGFANPFWGGLTGPSAHCAPAFPAVTTVIFAVFGEDTEGALARDMLNIAGYALLFALLPLFSANLGMTAKPGLVAGFAAALFPLYGQREMSRGRDEWLAALIGVLLTLYALRLARGEALTRRSALAYGAGWGALMYVHPAMVVILPLHMLVVLFARTRPPAQRIAFAGIVPVAFLLVVLPWIVRDRIAMGGWMFMRDDLGLELEISNGDGATPAAQANLATGWYCSQHPNCSHPVALRVLALGEREFNRQAMATATSWIRGHPARFADLTIRRVIAFWIGERSEPGFVALRLVLLFLGLAGFRLMWRGGLRIEAALLGAFWIAYPAAFYLIQRIDRYQAPMYPAILLPAAFACVALWDSLRKKQAWRFAQLSVSSASVPGIAQYPSSIQVANR
jgi:hypothetical protein